MYSESNVDVGSYFWHTMKYAKERDEGRAAAGLPIVDSWDCLKAFVDAYEDSCGELTSNVASYMWYACPFSQLR